MTTAEPEPGRRLRLVRERLGLKYRDVEEATQEIARRYGNPEFAVGLSRLADIENRGTVPSIYRVYSLCAVYALSYETILAWFGINLSKLATDMLGVAHDTTHMVEDGSTVLEGEIPALPAELPAETVYISRQMHKWGRLPLAALSSANIREGRYAVVGVNDWSMFPLLRPGSFVQIEENKRRIEAGPWASDAERPIYLVETRSGFRCAWCILRGKELILQFHPASGLPCETCQTPTDAEVVGQVVAVAMRLDQAKRHRIRF